MRNDTLRCVLRVTKALSDGQRIRILMMLRGGELCVCRLVEVLALAPSTVSKHLSILSEADLVEVRKEGRWAYYRLPQGEARKAVRPVLKWLEDRVGGTDAVLRDDKKLAEILAEAGCPPKPTSRGS
jgi:DNA-binding transcriptional ArsR family regulator